MHESFLPLVKFALSEDVGTGDVTTLNAVPSNVGARAAIVAKQPGVVSGIDIAAMTFRQVDASVKFKSIVRWFAVPAGAAIATISDRPRAS
jgi:nicotinate-nucleotide pyrophosphorylase (carboxylating)